MFFRRLKSWDVLQAAACLLCKVELSGKIKMEDRISNKIVVGKKDKIWALYGKSWKWSDGVKKCCKPVVTRNLDMQCQLVQKIDRNNHRPLLILVCNGPQSKNSMITLLWKNKWFNVFICFGISKLAPRERACPLFRAFNICLIQSALKRSYARQKAVYLLFLSDLSQVIVYPCN